MSVTAYQTAEMMEVMRRLPQPTNFWLQFFPTTFTSMAEKIMFDEIGEEERRLAPFVAPLSQGKVLRELGYVTRSFKPAYLKPKAVVSPQKTLSRRAGEAIGGSLTPAQRRDAVIADILASHRSMIERRWDWMAAQALIAGSVTVTGDDYPTQVVNFNRDASLTYTLTGNAVWLTGNAANPLDDIRVARTNSYNLGSYPVNTLVFGLGAWRGFTQNTAVVDLLSTQRRGSDSDFRAARLNAGEPWAYEGTIRGGPDGQGGFDCWTYQGTFRDEAGATQTILPTNTVVGIGSPAGVRAFGAIMEMSALEPAEMFPKMWMNQDPSVEYVMTQSAPLMVPTRPNSTFRINVE